MVHADCRRSVAQRREQQHPWRQAGSCCCRRCCTMARCSAFSCTHPPPLTTATPTFCALLVPGHPWRLPHLTPPTPPAPTSPLFQVIRGASIITIEALERVDHAIV